VSYHLVQDKCTLRARWAWATLGSGAKAHLRGCTLIRLPPLKDIELPFDWPAVRVQVPSWMMVGTSPAPNFTMFPADNFPPGALQELLNEPPVDDPSKGPPLGSTTFWARADAGTSQQRSAAAPPPAGASGAEAEHECAACGAKREDPGVELQLCSARRSVRYCSRECQRKHWKEHKAACKAAQK
jgi:hypothetical protein